MPKTCITSPVGTALAPTRRLGYDCRLGGNVQRCRCRGKEERAMTEQVLDTRGLSCPLPVLKARKRLQAMAAGERLRVLATDPKAPADFRLYCKESGHRLIEDAADGADFVLLLECVA
jgi:tRNA 2-thiouridine synthesizing protein A